MPGIAGFIRRNWSEQDGAVLDQMVARMNCEAFDRRGTCALPAAGIGVGWVCRQGSFTDCLPIWNETRDVCLVFAGEDFRDPQDVAALAAKGHRFPAGKAEYLVHLYEEHGIDFLARLNGTFSGVLIDLRDRKVVLFNDRYGLKRIYTHEAAGGFFFASEAKSLLAVMPHLRRLDPRGFAEFFSCRCVFNGRTLFPDISLLPNGSKWTFRPDGEVRREVYFDPASWEQQARLPAAEYSTRITQALGRVIPRYLGGGEPVALSLTGGIDSRLVLALAPPESGNFSTYTFNGPYRDCADVRIARRLAALAGRAHQTIQVDRGFFGEFPALAEKTVVATDGAMDVPGAVELYVNHRARQIAPVRLTGNYGSEILRDNVAFKPILTEFSAYNPDFLHHLKAADRTYFEELHGRRLSFIAFKQVPWYHYARSSLEHTQLTVRSPFLDNEIVQLAFQAPEELIKSPVPYLRAIAEANPAMGRIGTDRALRYRPIPVVTRLAHLYQEVTVRAEYMYDYGQPRWLSKLDHVVAFAHFERLFLGLHKFYHFRSWYRDALAGYVREMLLDTRTLNRPYLNRQQVERNIAAHLAGRENHTETIHILLTAELLQRTLIEGT